jgi:hypothetical protein
MLYICMCVCMHVCMIVYTPRTGQTNQAHPRVGIFISHKGGEYSLHTHTHPHTHAHTHTHEKCVCIYVYVYMYIYIYIYIYTHTHTHTHTYMHTSSFATETHQALKITHNTQHIHSPNASGEIQEEKHRYKHTLSCVT